MKSRIAVRFVRSKKKRIDMASSATPQITAPIAYAMPVMPMNDGATLTASSARLNKTAEGSGEPVDGDAEVERADDRDRGGERQCRAWRDAAGRQRTILRAAHLCVVLALDVLIECVRARSDERSADQCLEQKKSIDAWR